MPCYTTENKTTLRGRKVVLKFRKGVNFKA